MLHFIGKLQVSLCDEGLFETRWLRKPIFTHYLTKLEDTFLTTQRETKDTEVLQEVLSRLQVCFTHFYDAFPYT